MNSEQLAKSDKKKEGKHCIRKAMEKSFTFAC